MKVKGYTTVDGNQPHAHAYEIDDYGNGKTLALIGEGPPHYHSIMAKKLSPSGFDNHVHNLAKGSPERVTDEMA